MKKPLLIAEVKPQSPFREGKERWSTLFTLADRYGDMIAIHTDPRWGGSMGLLHAACRLTDKPVLAKGIHATDDEVEEAFRCGADSVLVVGRLPGERIDISRCMIEPTCVSEVVNINTFDAKTREKIRLVWNSRNLVNGGKKLLGIPDIQDIWSGWLCQASNIESSEDVYEGVDAVLVGTYLAIYTAAERGKRS